MKTISKVREGKIFVVTKQLEEAMDKDMLLNRRMSLVAQENDLKKQLAFFKDKIENTRTEISELDDMIKELEQLEVEEAETDE